jgi:hypothetical protein
MLRFIVRAGHRLTMQPYLEEWAGDFASRVEVISYDELFRSRKVPLVTHVFTDLECLTPEDREQAAFFWNQLERGPNSVRLLNHPLRAMRRFELLRHLHEQGINDFDVYRLNDPRKPKRFPVFLRVENDHNGPESTLIYNQVELDQAVERMFRQGKCAEERMITEFNAQKSPQGAYLKYGVFFIDGAVIPRHILFSTDWLVKGKSSFVDEQVIAEETKFLAENPHAQQVREVFRLAKIDYGRIDYGMVDGRIQVYEINSNPTIFSAGPWPHTPKKQRFATALTECFRRLEESTSQSGPKPRWVTLDRPLKDWRGRLASTVCDWVFGRQFRPII